MSYRNAWGYLRDLEKAAGFKFVERAPGGSPRAGMRLTARGETFLARYGTFLTVFDHLVIAVFVVEIAARFVAQGRAFFNNGWNLFDVFVVGVALAPATAAFSVLRALRVLRLLRLITAVPSLQRVVAVRQAT